MGIAWRYGTEGILHLEFGLLGRSLLELVKSTKARSVLKQVVVHSSSQISILYMVGFDTWELEI